MKNEQAYYSRKSNTYYKLNKKSLNFCIFRLTDKTRLNYIKSALAKSEVQDCKPVLLQLANSAPQCAFFVRSVYAPLKNNLSFDRLFPMVAHNGEGFALRCFPIVTVLQPVMCYRPSLQTFAVVPQNLQLETAEMIYKFLCVNRTHPHFNLCIQTIQANTEENARLSLNADFQCLSLVAKINPKFHRTLSAQGGIYA